ncbi:hypothetical protein Tchar_02424 [Tepidimonas charontis]|uniref:DUF6362 domain-containing protein n=2 Tax=Tepidimonas charontis TaxID=2267262 RepID=A0A554X401_9BURK|nr:hypothetical protein Tchar_02424 [Tepidimonas charontis]
MPDPIVIDRLEETIRWAQCLTEKQRHFVWMRAEEWGWWEIRQRFGGDRTTAWRRCHKALGLVADRLNGASAGTSVAIYCTK